MPVILGGNTGIYLASLTPPAFVGLLDTYSGAAAAYSLRRLSSSYTGNLIRVRRSSDNTEMDFGYDSNNVLDTAALLTFCGAGNGFVTTWYDQSGNGRNATNTTAANQPRIVNAGSLDVKNTKPTLYFDGTNDSLSIASQIFNSTTQSLFSAVQGSNEFGGLITAKTSTYDNAYAVNMNGTGKIEVFNGGVLNGTSPNFITSTSSITSAFSSVSAIYATTTSNVYINDVSQASGSIIASNNVASTTEIGKYRVGDTNFGLMNLSELIIYSSDQSSNRTGINTNINTFYSIY